MPPTAGYLQADGGHPEYGMLAGANVGHAARFVAERPTMREGFWGYIGRTNFELGRAGRWRRQLSRSRL